VANFFLVALLQDFLFIYLLSDLSKTGFHQKAQGLYKGALQVTKTDLQKTTKQIIVNVQNHKYTTDRYTTAINIKCTDNDIKHDETQEHGSVKK